MASDTGRDDFIIAIRSAFLKKGTRQKFSLFTLLIISILVLSSQFCKNLCKVFFKLSYFDFENFFSGALVM